MKNEIKYCDEYAVIYAKGSDSKIVEVLVSKTDTPFIEQTCQRLFASYRESLNNYYVYVVKKDNKFSLLHRLITDCPQDKVVDHINHDTVDNRRQNLRVVSRSENQLNRKGCQKNSKSGIRGVCWYPETGKWHSQIRINGKSKNLGYFNTIEEAKLAHDMALINGF